MKKSKTFLKIYLTIWILWAIFGLTENYKEILTQAGVKLWTKQGMEELCQTPKLRNTVDCLYPSGDFVTEFSAAFHTWAFLQIFVFTPLIVLIVSALVLYLTGIVAMRVKRKDWRD